MICIAERLSAASKTTASLLSSLRTPRSASRIKTWSSTTRIFIKRAPSVRLHRTIPQFQDQSIGPNVARDCLEIDAPQGFARLSGIFDPGPAQDVKLIYRAHHWQQHTRAGQRS